MFGIMQSEQMFANKYSLLWKGEVITMKKQNKSVYRMSGRELREYKRILRHRRELERRCLLVIATVCVIFSGMLSFRTFHSNASTGEKEETFKYYANVTVTHGESLWDIANDYIDYEYYKDKNAYIAEVCDINHLNVDASIQAGQNIIMPYYSSEYIN